MGARMDMAAAIGELYGNTTAGSDPEPALRAAFAQMVAGMSGAQGAVTAVVLSGYVERPTGSGRWERALVKKLHGSVLTAEGHLYGVTLEGQYRLNTFEGDLPRSQEG